MNRTMSYRFLIVVLAALSMSTEAMALGDAFFYGNFCGPGHPSIDPARPEIPQLEHIKPVDRLDAVCKKHDICYARLGMHTTYCDEEFRNGILSLKNLDAVCFGYAKFVYAAIVGKPSIKYSVMQMKMGKQSIDLFKIPSGGVLNLFMPLNVATQSVSFKGIPRAGSCR